MKARVAVSIACLAVACVTTLSAQRIADARSRREAIEFYRTGQEFMSAEKFDRAAEEFQKSVDRDELFTLAYYSLGQAYMNQQRFASAIKAYKDCIEATRSLYQLRQTNRFEVEKQRDDEIREVRETILRMRQARSGLGLQTRADQLEQHLQDLENQRRSIEGPFQPPSEVLLALGSAYFRNGDREQAEAEWKAATDVNPKLGEAHNNLAVIYMQTGRFDDAEKEIKLAEKNGFRVNPQFKQDLNDRRKKS